MNIKALSLLGSASAPRELLASGIEAVDRLLQGGFPRGSLVELVGPASSGRTSLLLCALARATGAGERVAYIDAAAMLDAAAARRAGVDLERLLWIQGPMDLGRALKAADLAVHSSLFSVVVLDLERARKGKSAGHSWFRLQRILRGSRTLLFLLAERPRTGGAARLLLSFEREQVRWRGASGRRARLLESVECRVELLRGGRPDHAAFHCDF